MLLKKLLVRHPLWIAATFLLVGTVLNADTLILRDGRRIEGQLISVQTGIIEFQASGFGGQPGRISRNDVTGIEFGRVDNGARNDRTDSPQNSQSGRPRGLREKQLTTAANVAWTDTGIDVQSG